MFFKWRVRLSHSSGGALFCSVKRGAAALFSDVLAKIIELLLYIMEYLLYIIEPLLYIIGQAAKMRELLLRPSFRLDEEVGVEQIFAVIAQGFAIGLADARPCGLADGMARCRVPLHRWGEAGIKVCLSLGDEAEF